jgi:hypothetical protein
MAGFFSSETAREGVGEGTQAAVPKEGRVAHAEAVKSVS